jgi:hypothetical protein
VGTISVFYNSSQILMRSSEKSYRHFIRTGTTSGSGTAILDSYEMSDVDKYDSSSLTWTRRYTTISKNTNYTANYRNSGDTAWMGAFGFTPTETLYSNSNMFTFTYNSTTSVTVKLRGWGGQSSSTLSWPSVKVTVGTKNSSMGLDTWMSSGNTFTGLTAGSTYTVTAALASNPGWTLGSTTITMPVTPTITGPSSITSTSSSISFSYSVSNATTARVYYGTSSSSMNSYKTLSTSGTSATITGLSENTTYYFYLYAYNSTHATDARSGTYSKTTLSNKPALWSWSASNGNATAAQTAAAKTAVDGQGYTTDFSYLVWNDLCDKVKEVLDYTGGTWNSSAYGLTLAQTKMSSSSKVLTAARFNSLRYNIGSHYSTGISEVSTGDTVYGSYFTTLATKINAWINSL